MQTRFSAKKFDEEKKIIAFILEIFERKKNYLLATSDITATNAIASKTVGSCKLVLFF